MNSDSFSQVKLQVALSPCLQMIIKPVLCWPWLWTMFTLTTSYWVSPDSVDHHSCYSDETRIFNLIRIILLSLFWLKSMCQLIIQWHNNSGADHSPVIISDQKWYQSCSIPTLAGLRSLSLLWSAPSVWEESWPRCVLQCWLRMRKQENAFNQQIFANEGLSLVDEVQATVKM